MTLPYRNNCKIKKKKTHIGLAIGIKSTHIKNMKLLRLKRNTVCMNGNKYRTLSFNDKTKL